MFVLGEFGSRVQYFGGYTNVYKYDVGQYNVIFCRIITSRFVRVEYEVGLSLSVDAVYIWLYVCFLL